MLDTNTIMIEGQVIDLNKNVIIVLPIETTGHYLYVPDCQKERLRSGFVDWNVKIGMIISHMLANFSKYGDELLKYWNESLESFKVDKE